jgi:hypothetical protein
MKRAGAVTPTAVALTVSGPETAFAMYAGAVAVPVTSETTVEFATNVPLDAVVGGVNVTVTPGTRFPEESVATTASATGKGFAICTCWGVVPVTGDMSVAPPGVFVSTKSAGGKPPAMRAVSAYVPAVLFAVKSGAMATLEAFVRTDAVVAPPANVPPAAEAGVLNVTNTPAPTRLFDESLTVA